MLARLILALVLAAFAFPALANGPCHDAPQVATSHHAGHHRPARGDAATPAHVCLGCIPPASLASRPFEGPARAAAPARAIVAAAFAPQSGTPPALPPPRRDA